MSNLIWRSVRCLLLFTALTTAARSRSKPSGPQFLQQPEGQTSTEGSTVKLYCDVKGYPEPKVTWFRNGFEIKKENSVQILRNDLLLMNLNTELTGSYTCVAENINGHIESIPALVQLQYFGTKFKETPKDVVQNAGEELRIPCVPPDGYPTPTVDWYKNGQFLNIDGERIKYEENNLIFTELKDSDAGFYLCRAENPAGKLESQAIKLRVNIPPYFIESPLGEVSVNLGDEVFIPCPIGGDPTPKMDWVRRDGRMPNKKVEVQGNLRIPNVQLNDQGTYRCRGENTVGSIQMDVRLKVRQPPRFAVTPKNQTIRVGQEAKFECQMLGEPEPTVYWQTGDGRILPNDRHYDINPNGQLSIQNAQYTDNGVYTCIGKNSAGLNRVSVRLNVIKYDLREPPIILTVLQNENTLECQIQNANQKDTSWKLNDTLIRKSTYLTPIENGTYSCSVENDYGSALFSFDYPISTPLSDIEQSVKNLTLVRTQEEIVVVSFDTGQVEKPHKYRLYQLDTGGQDAAFRKIIDFDGTAEQRQQIELAPRQLLSNRGSFYIFDITNTKSSYSTGLLDLSSKQVKNEFDLEKRGIVPVQCEILQSAFRLVWSVSNSVKESCSRGYTVVIDGPKSNVVTVPCSKLLYEVTLSTAGIYKIRVESRENSELGAYFIIEVSTKGTRNCINNLVVNTTAAWIDNNKLQVRWKESAIVTRGNVLIDSYQIIATDDSGQTNAKKVKRIEATTDQPDTFEFFFDSISVVANYSVEVNPIVSAAQAKSSNVKVDQLLLETFFSNLLQSPLFVAIISSVILITIIICGAIVFVCLRNRPANKRHQKACFRPGTNGDTKSKKTMTKDELFGDFTLGDDNDANWNQTLAQTLLPDFSVIKQNGGNELQMSYISSNGNSKSKLRSSHGDSIHMTTSHNAPDIQSAHYTISPLKNELVHVDLLEGTHSSRYSNGYTNRSQRSMVSSSRNLPPPPPMPPSQHVHGSSNSSTSSILSDYNRQRTTTDPSIIGRISPHHLNPASTRYRINEPYSELDSVIVDDSSVAGTTNSHQSRRSNQPHYYDINDFKPLYPDRPLYSVQKNSDSHSYRQHHTSNYLQPTNTYYTQEYAALSPVNEV